MSGEWLPPQAPGSSPPPPAPPGAPPPPPPFEIADDPPPPADDPAPTRAAPPAEADTRPNNDAVAAIACALSGAGLLIWTNGLSSVVSLVLGIFGVYFAGQGRRNVEQGRTAKHGDLANGAQVAGWITIGLSVVATIVWILVIALGT